MNEIAAAWIGVGGATAVGLVGWILAGVSNRRAKDANELAENANKLAADAVRQAREANDIAQHANHLSEEANTIAQRQAAQLADPSHVEWDAQFDGEASVLKITNRGRDTALHSSALITGHDVDKFVRSENDLPRGAEIVIPFPEIPDRRQQHELEQERIRNDPRYAGILLGFASFQVEIDIDVRWTSEAGKPGQQTLQHVIS